MYEEAIMVATCVYYNKKLDDKISTIAPLPADARSSSLVKAQGMT